MEVNNVDTIHQQFNMTIGKWIDYLEDYTLEMLWQIPQAGFWSLGQVYVHIIDDTGYFVGQIKIALLNKADSGKEMRTDAKAMLRNNEFPDLLLQGPSTNVALRQPQSKDELVQGLQSIKDEVNTLYATFDFSTSQGKAEHPAFQFFTALEWLQFAEMHMRHHFRQKGRIDERLFRGNQE